MIDPLITIQIPTYNQKQYIKEALDSALAQTYKNLQIIVSDDCSPDYDIFEYLFEYQDNPKIIIHRNEKNLGRVGNYRNTLYNLVQGEWFVNLDGDDYFTDIDFVTIAIESIQKTSIKISLFQADAEVEKIFIYDIPFYEVGRNIFVVKGLEYLKNIDNGVGFSHASILYNVFEARECDFFNINTLDIDYFSYLKILKRGSIIFCSNKVYHWRQHLNQQTHSINFNECKFKYMEFNDLVSFYREIPSEYKNTMLEITYFKLTVQLITHFFKGKINFKDFIFLVRKTKYEIKYFKPFLSAIKNGVLKF